MPYMPPEPPYETEPYRAPHTHTAGAEHTVRVMSASDARIERLEALIHGYEGTLRAIRSRAQAGVMVTSPVWAAELFETIDALAALALMHGPVQVNSDERTYDEW